ncbi:NADH-quinone oxidoreductase subunit C [candidate division KSB1 bacterium]
MKAEEIIDVLKENFGDKILDTESEVVEPSVTVDPAAIVEVCTFLKTDPGMLFASLMSLSGIDLDEENLRVDYHLHSIEKKHKFKLKVVLPKSGPNVPSVAGIWKTADWHEREAYDLFGVIFNDHPDFRRILLPDDWEGYPLRKDYVTPDTYRDMPVPSPGKESDANKETQ